MVFGSTMLEVAIGMIFVYLLISLLCSALNELINSVFKLRAWDLERGIMRLLGDQRTRGFFQHWFEGSRTKRLWRRLTGKGAATPPASSQPAGGAESGGIADAFFNHPLIKPLYEDRKPSYIPSRTFSLALWNIATQAAENAGLTSPSGVVTSPSAAGDQRIAGVTKNLQALRNVIEDGMPGVPTNLKVSLVTLIDEADNKFDEARANIEKWYNDSMDRVSGAFRRRTHYILLALGFAVSLGMNVDTFNIFRALYTSQDLRKTVVAAAENYVDAPLPGTTPTPAAGAATATPTTSPTPTAAQQLAETQERIKNIKEQIDELGLPIGWDCEFFKAGAAANSSWVQCKYNDTSPRGIPTNLFGWLFKLAGIFLTALAVSQGAPFWFDILNKFIVIRSTVKPEEKSQTQPSKDSPAPNTDNATAANNNTDEGDGPNKG